MPTHADLERRHGAAITGNRQTQKKKNPLPFWSHFGDENEAICETQVLGHTQREMRRRWKGCHFFVPLSLRTETCREEGSSWQSIAPSDPYWAPFTHGRRVYQPLPNPKIPFTSTVVLSLSPILNNVFISNLALKKTLF